MRTAIGMTLAVIVAASSWAHAADDKLADKLPGTYTYVSGVKAGEEVSKDSLSGKVRITKDNIALISEGGDEEFLIAYKIEGEEAGRAKIALEITKASIAEAAGSKAKGLAKLDGDTLTIAYDYGEGAKTPADFDAKGAMQHRFVLKRSAENK